MTDLQTEAKKKAEELIESFLIVAHSVHRDTEDNREVAKDCAKIAVNELIKVAPIDKFDNLDSEHSVEEVGLHLFEEFWQEALNQIERL